MPRVKITPAMRKNMGESVISRMQKNFVENVKSTPAQFVEFAKSVKQKGLGDTLEQDMNPTGKKIFNFLRRK